MIRLTVLLCCGVFVVLLVAGEDKGQTRQGLLQPPVMSVARKVPASTVKVAEPKAAAADPVFVPAQPVRVIPAPQVVTPVIEAAADPQTENRVAVVSARSANVRSGPSTFDAIVGQLSSGEQVVVLSDDSGADGWSLIKIEGDGLKGYIANRLLQPVQP